MVATGGSGESDDVHVRRDFGGNEEAVANGNLTGMVGARDGRRIRTLKETGKVETRCSWYDGTEAGDARVGG